MQPSYDRWGGGCFVICLAYKLNIQGEYIKCYAIFFSIILHRNNLSLSYLMVKGPPTGAYPPPCDAQVSALLFSLIFKGGVRIPSGKSRFLRLKAAPK